MKKATPFIEAEPVGSPKDALTEILRSGAQRMLAAALETEVQSYLAEHADARDESGHRLVVRNGHCPERTIQTVLTSAEWRFLPSQVWCGGIMRAVSTSEAGEAGMHRTIRLHLLHMTATEPGGSSTESLHVQMERKP